MEFFVQNDVMMIELEKNVSDWSKELASKHNKSQDKNFSSSLTGMATKSCR